MTTSGYLRVSTTEQGDSGPGLDAQRSTIEASPLIDGIAEWVEDVGESGAVAPAGRPGASVMLEQLRRGDTLVVAKLDRLGRDVLDVVGMARQAEKARWRLVVLDLGLDTSVPVGRSALTTLAAVAQQERDLITERTSDALAALRRRGVRTGRPPITPEPTRQRIAQMRADGLTLRAMAHKLNDDGVPTANGGSRWRANSVRSVLRSVELDTELQEARS